MLSDAPAGGPAASAPSDRTPFVPADRFAPRARWLAAALRVVVLALLVSSLLVPSLWRAGAASARVVRVRSSADLARPASILTGAAPVAVTYESATAPSAVELETLAAAAERAPVYGAIPRTVHLVEASATARPLAGRAAAVSFRIRGPAGDSVRVYLAEGGITVDSASVRADASGEAAGAFRVRPSLPGWREWSVHAAWARGDSASALAGAWVDSAEAPRVLVRAGFPEWEAKFVTRALEESGARVDESLALGRGLAVGEGAGGAITPARLARADAVIVVDGAPLAAAEEAVLAEWVSRGGGVLLAGDRAGAAAFGVVRGGGRSATVDGATLRWTQPPELAPLPAERVASAAQPFGALVAGSALAASTPAGGVLAVRPLGRGRAAALALTETWRWRMEAGRIAEHREFWRSLVDWLSSARADSLTIDLPAGSGAAGARAEVRVYDTRASGILPTPVLVVARPDRSLDTLRLARDSTSPGTLRGSFVPATPGLYAFSLAGGRPSAGFRAAAAGGAPSDAWARLALLSRRSGGRMLPADSIGRTVAALTADVPGGVSRTTLAAVILGALVVVAGAEWAIRRLTARE